MFNFALNLLRPTAVIPDPKLPRPGDLIVYPGLYLAGKRVKIGHVGMVVSPIARLPPPPHGEPALRAHVCVDHGDYELGKGGTDPKAPWPFDEDDQCDCSGFVSWCLGLPRKNPKMEGGWLSTDSIFRDAQKGGGLFDFVCKAPADLLIVHCASSKWKEGKIVKRTAVRRSDSALWARKKGVVARLRTA